MMSLAANMNTESLFYLNLYLSKVDSLSMHAPLMSCDQWGIYERKAKGEIPFSAHMFPCTAPHVKSALEQGTPQAS